MSFITSSIGPINEHLFNYLMGTFFNMFSVRGCSIFGASFITVAVTFYRMQIIAKYLYALDFKQYVLTWKI